MLQKLEWIKSQLLLEETASQAASRLNTPFEIDNPVTQTKVSAPVDVDNLWVIVPSIEVFKVLNTLIWDRVVKAIEKNNKVLIKNYITALVAGGCLTQGTATKITAALSGEMLDPNWQPKINTTLAKQAGFNPILVSEVQTVIDQTQISISS